MEFETIRRRLEGRKSGIQDVAAEYAVLVPLVEEAGELRLLFEVRASGMRRQPGEICFPGGQMEPGETGKMCALRETEEELGIPAEKIRVIAPLDCLFHQSGMLLHPVLAQVESGALKGLRLNAAETAEAFTVPLSFFLTHAPVIQTYALEPRVGEDFPYERMGLSRDYPWQSGQVEVPIYLWEGRTIWGLTGRVVRNLVWLLRGEDRNGGAV